MTISIRGTGTDRVLRARARARLDGALAHLKVAPVTALVTFIDDNGPKGGRASRCALTVRLPYQPNIRVEETATTPRLAFDAAFASLERQLERYREEQRKRGRYPKKYFVAKRLLTAE